MRAGASQQRRGWIRRRQQGCKRGSRWHARVLVFLTSPACCFPFRPRFCAPMGPFSCSMMLFSWGYGSFCALFHQQNTFSTLSPVGAASRKTAMASLSARRRRHKGAKIGSLLLSPALFFCSVLHSFSARPARPTPSRPFVRFFFDLSPV